MKQNTIVIFVITLILSSIIGLVAWGFSTNWWAPDDEGTSGSPGPAKGPGQSPQPRGTPGQSLQPRGTTGQSPQPRGTTGQVPVSIGTPVQSVPIINSDGLSCTRDTDCISRFCLRNTCRSIGWCSIGSDCPSGFCGGINSCTDGALNSSCNANNDCSSGYCNLVTRRCEPQPTEPPVINFTYNTNMANGLEITNFTYTGDLRPTDSVEISVSFDDSSLSGSGTLRTVNLSELLNRNFFVAGRPDSPDGRHPGNLIIKIIRNSVEITRKSIRYTEIRSTPPE